MKKTTFVILSLLVVSLSLVLPIRAAEPETSVAASRNPVSKYSSTTQQLVDMVEHNVTCPTFGGQGGDR